MSEKNKRGDVPKYEQCNIKKRQVNCSGKITQALILKEHSTRIRLQPKLYLYYAHSTFCIKNRGKENIHIVKLSDLPPCV